MNELIHEHSGIRLSWNTDNKVLCVDFEQNWDPSTYFSMVRRANTFVTEQPMLNGVIMCFLKCGLSPATNLFVIWRQTLRQMPKNVHTVVIVNQRSSTRVMIEAFLHTLPFHAVGKNVRFLLAESMEEAYQMLQA